MEERTNSINDYEEPLNNNQENLIIKEYENANDSDNNDFNKYKAKTLSSRNSSESEIIEEEQLYPIYINFPEFNDQEEDNSISTRKYKWYNFFPKMLLIEFSRLANSYFLIIAVLQTIKEISYSDGIPLILIPLTFVICINGVKDLYEDYKRKESDNKENNSLCYAFDSISNTFVQKKWYTIKHGDIVKILKDEQIPADLLLLTTSDESGFCYIETKNIDGETNLKSKQSNQKLKNQITKDEDLSKLKYICVTKPPDEYIYKFDATLYKINQNSQIENNNEFILIDSKSFLLRGCTLRQTDYIIGVAIYIGENTKTMINAPKVKIKHSTVESIMNKQIILVFILQIVISFIASFIHVILYIKDFKSLQSYIYVGQLKKENLIRLLFKIAGTWALVLSNIVPISLLVTMETIKFFQSWVMAWDIDMYDQTKTYGCKVQTSTLNEELGQIKYIFTDKTGTLTKNHMNFKMMSIGLDAYGSLETDSSKIDSLNDSYGKITNVDFLDLNNNFQSDLNNNTKNGLINHFMINLCLCNSVIIDKKLFDKSNIINYQASSPDEMALVSFARSQNYIFLDRTSDDYIFLEINGEKENYKILNILEYSSERKRMSIICETPDGEIIHYIKGADSAIEKLLNEKNKKSNELANTKQYLKNYSTYGLRTLMLAYKELSREEYDEWNNKYESVKKSPTFKEEDILKLYDEIERDFNVLGSTAIEDQLQDNVNDVIDSFVSIGIKIWMLTGDKYETAKNIAYSCKLFQHNMNILEVGEYENKKELKNRLKNIYNDNKIYFDNEKNYFRFGLIIGGNELEKIFLDHKLLILFSQICLKCTSVICCRASPKQKAQLVKMIKELDGAITLAIGDGANDVGMITEANVGIGIQGIEGTQAARSSDYVLSQFSHIKKLLFFHGREYYRRNSWVIGYNFYKNFIYISPIFWAGIITLFSGVTIFDPWILQLYNTLFVALPCGWYGIYSLEYPQQELINHPEYYIQGMEGKCFSMEKFSKFIGFAFGEGFLIYYLGNYWFDAGNDDGTVDDFYAVGTAVYGAIVIIANLRIVLQTNIHEFYSIMITSLSALSFFLAVFLMSNNYVLPGFIVREFLILDNWKEVILDIKFYAYVLLVSTICYFIEICSDKYPELFLKKEKYVFNRSRAELKYIENNEEIENDEKKNNEIKPDGEEVRMLE